MTTHAKAVEYWPDATPGHHQPPRVPAPTAPIGTLLELVQLARFATRSILTSGASARSRTSCLAIAKTHASLLLAAPATAAQRAFVASCDVPWSALEDWIDQARAAARRPMAGCP